MQKGEVIQNPRVADNAAAALGPFKKIEFRDNGYPKGLLLNSLFALLGVNYAPC